MPKRCFPASTKITELLSANSGYHLDTSFVRKSWSSLVNSIEVGPKMADTINFIVLPQCSASAH